ncbi:MAG: CRP-like cAMP-binding protein [Myxococcota bacterium]|jgi:CRP-like cAMP-binding protein
MMDRALLKTRLDALLASWSFPGVASEPLIPVLEQGVSGWFAPGKVLCEEGDAGDRMFFLFEGSIEVLKKDRSGRNVTLTTMTAPALLGHMSLMDRSPRSATCIVQDRAYVGILSEAVFNRFTEDRGESGTVLRRLILASLSRQLSGGDSRLQALLSGPEAGIDEEQAHGALRSTVGVLEGWSPSEAVESEEWKTRVARQARNLPLESGASLKLQIDSGVPLSLVMRDLSPGLSERVVQRVIRFTHTIPTPPVLELVYINCTSSLLQRPQQVSKQLRFYFPRNAYQISGDEEKVTVLFPGADPRW